MRDGAIWHEDEKMTYPDLIKAHFGMVGGELIGRGEVRPEHGSGSYAEGPVSGKSASAASSWKSIPIPARSPC